MPLRHLIILIADAHSKQRLRLNERHFVQGMIIEQYYFPVYLGLDAQINQERPVSRDQTSHQRLGRQTNAGRHGVHFLAYAFSKPYRLPDISGQIFSLRCMQIRHCHKDNANLLFQQRVNVSMKGRCKQSCIRHQNWWSWTGSNRRPEACKATALPTELQPRNLININVHPARIEWWAWVDLNYRPHPYQACALTT